MDMDEQPGARQPIPAGLQFDAVADDQLAAVRVAVTRELFEEYRRFLWIVMVVRGVLAVLFGAVVLAWPAPTLFVVAVLFGVFMIVDGIAGVVRAIANRTMLSTWMWWAAMAVVSAIAGVAVVVWPAIGAFALLYIIAIHAIVYGVLALLAARRSREVPGRSWGWTLAHGIAAIIFGWLLIVFPGTGIIGLMWLLGTYAIVGGLLLIVAGVTVRRSVRSEAAA